MLNCAVIFVKYYELCCEKKNVGYYMQSQCCGQMVSAALQWLCGHSGNQSNGVHWVVEQGMMFRRENKGQNTNHLPIEPDLHRTKKFINYKCSRKCQKLTIVG